jgi:pimeloyl-ACP methyl ester carboxylesterase
VNSGPASATPTVLPSTLVHSDLLQRSQDRRGFEIEYPFDSKWFRTPDGIQHYIDEGSGPPLLMVHGNPTWSFAWRRLVTALKDRFRVIAIDHLGCGFSQKPANSSLYTLQHHISHLSQLVQLLDLHHITLFGHDWGGAIGMGCAASMPARFDRFVLMNTGAFRSQAIPLRIAVCRIPLAGELGVRGLNLFSRAALSMAVVRPLSPAARAGYLAPYNSWANRIAVHEFVQDIPLTPRHRSYAALLAVEQGLEQFRNHPLQLIWGLQDWCFTPDEFLEGFRSRFPQADVLRLPEAGHYVFEDAPNELLTQVKRFLHSP